MSAPSRHRKRATGARFPGSPAGMRIWPSASRRYPGRVVAGAAGGRGHADPVRPSSTTGPNSSSTTIPTSPTFWSRRAAICRPTRSATSSWASSTSSKPSTASSSIYAHRAARARRSTAQGGVPVDNIGQIQIEMRDYRERRKGNVILEEIRQKTAHLAGVHVEVRVPEQGPPTGKDVMIDISSDNYAGAGADDGNDPPHLDTLPELRDLEDTRPLPGIEWDIDIDRDVANRFGANAQTIGTAVQLVTDGILVGEYRPGRFHAAGRHPRALSRAIARHPCARRRARGDARRHGADQQFREAEAGAAGQFDRARRRPSRLSRPRQCEARRPGECGSREAEGMGGDPDAAERRARQRSRARTRSRTSPACS